MPRLSISLLGSFQTTLASQPVTDFVTDKARALLAYLAVERDRPQRRESLAGLLWPDQADQDARRNLRQALFNLRQALADTNEQQPWLCIDRNDVQFAPGADLQVDVAAFTQLLAQCDQHRHRRLDHCRPCLLRLEQLITLYRGEFLAGFSLDDSTLFEEWLLLKREWLHSRAVEALITLADYHERRGEYDQARRYAQQQVHFEPWREEAHRQLMRLLALDGQRSAALAQYQTCLRVLQAELGVEPSTETIKLFEQIKLGSVPVPIGSALPLAPTPLVGREIDRAELADRLASPEGRLITLLGPGGIGKTRLALQVAHDQRGLFVDGVYWAALGSIGTADLIVPTIASAVGLALYGKEPPHSQLLNFLRAKHLLIVLDNVEQLPEVSSLVADLLRRAPQVTLLITSRERLALQEEWMYEVEGLPYPSEVNDAVEAYAAPRLFTQSARRVARKFAVTPIEQAALVRICQLVEGMPLALEMAAAWTTTRTCSEIAQAIEASLDLLATTWRNVPERQRSVRATFEHSWAQLPDRERIIFARLAVFRGGFNAAAAEQITTATPADLDALVSRSLLRLVTDDRYQLHELLRQFAIEKLNSSADEVTAIAAQHARYYAAFLAERETDLKSAAQEAALHTIELEIANVRRAWEWAIEANDATALDILRQSHEALLMFFWLRSWFHEGATLFARAVAAVESSPGADQLLLGQLLARQARCMEFTAPVTEATALYQRSLTIFQTQPTRENCALPYSALPYSALPLFGLGYMAHLQGRFAEARQNYETSLALYREAADRWGAANVLSNLCLSLRRQGAFEEARRCGLESLELRRAIGDRRGIASSQNNLALIYTALNEHAAAETALRESIEICRDIGHPIGEANALTILCQLVYYAGDHAAAFRHQSAALKLYQQVGDLWGVAVAHNNLGQLNLENTELAEAMTHFQHSVKLYRQLGIQTGLANALSNVGQVHYLRGEWVAAAHIWDEALQLTLHMGDVPIGLEILLRAATLWAQQDHDSAPLSVIFFVQQQPALLEETRRMSAEVYAKLHHRFTPEVLAAAEALARQCDFECMVSQVLTVLRDIK